MTAISIPRPAWLARPVARRWLIAGTAIVVIVLYLLFRDQFGLEHDDRAPVFRSLETDHVVLYRLAPPGRARRDCRPPADFAVPPSPGYGRFLPWLHLRDDARIGRESR